MEKLSKPCLTCGKLVYYKESTKDRAKYCSVTCKATAQLGKKLIRTKPRSGEMIICNTCGKEFYRTQSELKKGSRRYCCFACRNKGGYLGNHLYGANRHNWKGGKTKIKGYIYILSRGHPFKNSSNYVAEHRIVMERFLGRYLTKEESIHHRNGIKADNRIENLQIVANSPHTGEVNCPYCQKIFLIR